MPRWPVSIHSGRRSRSGSECRSGGQSVVSADEVVVVDAPDLLAVLPGRLLSAPRAYAEALADVLLLPLAGWRWPPRCGAGGGVRCPR